MNAVVIAVIVVASKSN